jgi:hypothetical protein
MATLAERIAAATEELSRQAEFTQDRWNDYVDSHNKQARMTDELRKLRARAAAAANTATVSWPAPAAGDAESTPPA